MRITEGNASDAQITIEDYGHITVHPRCTICSYGRKRSMPMQGRGHICS
jgi:hypothetical protein